MVSSFEKWKFLCNNIQSKHKPMPLTKGKVQYFALALVGWPFQSSSFFFLFYLKFLNVFEHLQLHLYQIVFMSVLFFLLRCYVRFPFFGFFKLLVNFSYFRNFYAFTRVSVLPVTTLSLFIFPTTRVPKCIRFAQHCCVIFTSETTKSMECVPARASRRLRDTTALR